MKQEMLTETIRREAYITECGTYRYTLKRVWDDTKPFDAWLMLNPSTADAMIDDPTIRRCMGFSREWGAGGIVVLNLFAFRSTDPTALPDNRLTAVGSRNDAFIGLHAMRRRVICAWGCHGTRFGRDREVVALLKDRECVGIFTLGTTKHGHPKHPLYVAGATELMPFGPSVI